jgi:hypothetical protein
MTRIVMQIAIDPPAVSDRNETTTSDTCCLYLHQSLSAQVAFDVLRTPVILCEVNDLGPVVYQRSHLDKPDAFLRVSSTTGPTPENFGLSIIPVFVIKVIVLLRGASLHSRYPVNIQDCTFQLVTDRTIITTEGDDRLEENCLITTALELLKLPRIRTFDRSSMGSDGAFDDGLPFPRGELSLSNPNKTSSHVVLTLGRLGVESLIQRVCRNLKYPINCDR